MPSEWALNDRSNELLGCARRRNGSMISILWRMWWLICISLQFDGFVPHDRPQTPIPPNTPNDLPRDHDLGVTTFAHYHPSLCSATLCKLRSQCGLTGWQCDRRPHQNPVPSNQFQRLCIATMLWVVERQRLDRKNDPPNQGAA